MHSQDAFACPPFLDEASTGWDPEFFLNREKEPGSPTNSNSTRCYEHADLISVEDGFLGLNLSDAQTRPRRSQFEEIPLSMPKKQDSAPNSEERRWLERPISAGYLDHQVHLDREFCAKAGSTKAENNKLQPSQPARMGQRRSLETHTEGLRTRHRPMRVQKNRQDESRGTTLAIRKKLEKAPEELLKHPQ
jgi:hypothetical protein